MDAVRIHPRHAGATGADRLRAPRSAAAREARAARAPRRAALLIALAVLILLLLAAEAQAYVPGQLIWAKRIGTSAGEASAWAVAGGPGGVAAIAGWQSVAPTGQVPMVARFTPGGARWVRTYTSPGRAEDVTIDKAGNVYVAGIREAKDLPDILTIKYSPAGVRKWLRAWSGGGPDDDDEPSGLVIGAKGDLFVGAEATGKGDVLQALVLRYKR